MLDGWCNSLWNITDIIQIPPQFWSIYHVDLDSLEFRVNGLHREKIRQNNLYKMLFSNIGWNGRYWLQFWDSLSLHCSEESGGKKNFLDRFLGPLSECKVPQNKILLKHLLGKHDTVGNIKITFQVLKLILFILSSVLLKL